MQRKNLELSGLRLACWALVLFIMLALLALIFDRREPATQYRDAVLVYREGIL